MKPWTARQFGAVIDKFKANCPADAWTDVLLRYALLKEKGPACGNRIAKKLTNAKGIWELLGHAGNHQPRPLFYFRDSAHEIAFVHAFMKKGKNNYPPAIKLAQQRRRLIEFGEKPLNVITVFKPNVH